MYIYRLIGYKCFSSDRYNFVILHDVLSCQQYRSLAPGELLDITGYRDKQETCGYLQYNYMDSVYICGHVSVSL